MDDRTLTSPNSSYSTSPDLTQVEEKQVLSQDSSQHPTESTNLDHVESKPTSEQTATSPKPRCIYTASLTITPSRNGKIRSFVVSSVPSPVPTPKAGQHDEPPARPPPYEPPYDTPLLVRAKSLGCPTGNNELDQSEHNKITSLLPAQADRGSHPEKKDPQNFGIPSVLPCTPPVLHPRDPFNYNEVIGTNPGLSLRELIEKNPFPLRVVVVKGDGVKCQNGDIFDLNLVKKTKIVTLVDMDENSYTLPFNTAAKVGLIYSPRWTYNESSVFKTVADMIHALEQPKIVMATRRVKGLIDKNEVLMLQQLVKSGRSQKLNVYSFTNQCEKTIPYKSEGRFTTDPRMCKLFLPEFVEKVPKLFPTKARIYFEFDKKVPLPDALNNKVITLQDVSVNTIIVATKCTLGVMSKEILTLSGEISEPVELPVESDIRVAQINSTNRHFEESGSAEEDLLDAACSTPSIQGFKHSKPHTDHYKYQTDAKQAQVASEYLVPVIAKTRSDSQNSVLTFSESSDEEGVYAVIGNAQGSSESRSLNRQSSSKVLLLVKQFEDKNSAVTTDKPPPVPNSPRPYLSTVSVNETPPPFAPHTWRQEEDKVKLVSPYDTRDIVTSPPPVSSDSPAQLPAHANKFLYDTSATLSATKFDASSDSISPAPPAMSPSPALPTSPPPDLPTCPPLVPPISSSPESDVSRSSTPATTRQTLTSPIDATDATTQNNPSSHGGTDSGIFKFPDHCYELLKPLDSVTQDVDTGTTLVNGFDTMNTCTAAMVCTKCMGDAVTNNEMEKLRGWCKKLEQDVQKLQEQVEMLLQNQKSSEDHDDSIE